MEQATAPAQKCRTCGETKPLAEFDIRADTGKRKTQCKGCRRAYQNQRNSPLDPDKPRAARVVGTTELLTCTRCGEMKPSEAFPRRKRDGSRLQSWCRDCFAEVKAVHYAEHREEVQQRIYSRAERLREETRQKLIEYVAEHLCPYGQTDPTQYRFIDTQGRRTTLAALATSGRAWGTIQDALATSTVTCVRCIRAAAGRDTREAIRPSPRTRTRPHAPIGTTDGLRRCTRCGEVKPLEDFAARYRALPTPTSHCRDCRAAYQRDWYQRNRDKVMERARENRRKPKELRDRKVVYLDARRRRWEYLLEHPCVDCGETDPVVLEFDHRSDKRSAIVDLMRRHARWEEILQEIEKCDVRCANCHRRRTARTRGYYRELSSPDALGGPSLGEPTPRRWNAFFRSGPRPWTVSNRRPALSKSAALSN